MKLKKLLFGLALVAFSAQAQFTFEDLDGKVYEDGDTYITNSLIFDVASLDYKIINETNEEIYMIAELVSATGANGDNFEICLGLCYSGVSIGQRFPSNGSVAIDANGDTGEGVNHIYHGGGDTDPDVVATYTMRYTQTTEDGNTDIGDDFTFIYQYDPNALGINDVEAQAGVSVASTVLRDSFNFDATIGGTVALYDIQGRLVSSQVYTAGQQAIDVSSLRSQMYIATFTTNEGRTQSIKLIKK